MNIDNEPNQADETLSDFEILKFNLQEEKFPHFTDDELKTLLKIHGSVEKASYEGCLIKSYTQVDSVGPVSITLDSKYWLMRADYFKSLILKDKNKKRSKHRTMKRADES